MIVLDRVTRRYDGRSVLTDLSLKVAGGEVVALVGPNGAGKSTALRVLAGIIRPHGGAALLAGQPVTTGVPASRELLGYLPQKLGVPLTAAVSDLCGLVARVRGVPERVLRDSLGEAGLSDRWNAQMGDLSGGQRQRVMLLLATAGPVRALLLDEPSISLDAEGSEEVRTAIRAARSRGAAVLFASHHLTDVARLADRIIIMAQGRIVAQGTLAGLAEAAEIPLRPDALDPPIERIYRTLLLRNTGAARRDAGEVAA